MDAPMDANVSQDIASTSTKAEALDGILSVALIPMRRWSTHNLNTPVKISASLYESPVSNASFIFWTMCARLTRFLYL